MKKRRFLSVLLALCLVFGSYSKAPAVYGAEDESAETTIAAETAADLEAALEEIAETITGSKDEVTTAGVAEYVDPTEDEQTEAPALPDEKEEEAQAPETQAPVEAETGHDTVEETAEPESKEAEPAVEETVKETEAEEPKAEEPEEPKAEEPEDTKAEEPEETKAEEPAETKAEEPKAEEPEQTQAEEPEETKAEEPEQTQAEEPEETKAEEPAAEPEPVAQTVYTKAIAQATVTVIANADAFDEEVQLVVTPLAAGSDEYKDAEAALVNEGKAFDGMMAFDIAFVSAATGEEVEPNSPVTVKMTVNKGALTELNANAIDTDSMTVSHITEDAVVDVADAADETEGQLTVNADGAEMKSIKAEFEVEDFSPYVITWMDGETEKTFTVHWGIDTEDGFEELTTPSTIDSTASSVDINIIIDAEKYYFIGADYRLTEDAEEFENLKSTVLHNSDGWTMELEESGTTAPADGSHIYVHYAEYSEANPYTPPTPPTPDVLSPETDKTVTDNGDGTYTIRLDIEGKSDHSTTKIGANVIVIMDITQSMSNGMTGGSTRMEAAKTALTTLINTLDPDTNLINFRAINFGDSRNAYDYDTTGIDRFKLGLNWTTSKSAMQGYADGLPGPDDVNDFGTCWQAALRGGYEIVTEEVPASNDLKNNATYVVFVTDGNPNCYTANNDGTGSWTGASGPGYNATAYSRAAHWADLLGPECEFYGVYCGNRDDSGYGYLEQLITNANGTNENFINGTSTSAIEEAFQNIAQTIVNNLGAGGVTVDDGIPTLSNISANVSAGEAGGFKYYIKPAGGTETEWTKGATSDDDPGAPGATYSNTNGVTWDLGEAGELKNGWIYSVEFTVWPSQAAYDLIADLNNGIKDWDDLTDEQKASVDGSKEEGYTLKTNTHLYTNFTDLDGNTYQEVNDATPKAMDLPAPTISVEKLWHNWLDSRDDVDIDGLQLVLSRDGEEYLRFDVDESTDWKKDGIYISCGQIVDGEIVETGHDYYVTEIAKEDVDKTEYWEVNSPYYHPMVVDGEMQIFIQDDEASSPDFEYNGHKYVAADSTAQSLTAINERVSWLNLTKVVTGEDAPADAEFTYTVTITQPDGDDIYFSCRGGGMNYRDDLETSAEKTTVDGNTYYVAKSGEAFTISNLVVGWNIRFLNLATESTYTITEETAEMPDGFAFDSAKSVETLYVGRDSSGRIPADGYPKTTNFDDPTVEGTINQTNTDYSVTYTNKYELIDIEFTKEWVDGDNQDGIRPSADDFDEYLSLLVNGEAADEALEDAPEADIEDNEDNTYTISYTDVPKYVAGEEAEYTLEESEIDGYTTTGSPAEVDGTITNTHEPATTTVSATKEWDDNDDADGMREDITFVLYADGEPIEEGAEKTIAADATGDDLTVTWEDLPVYANGAEIEYTVEEKGVEDGKITMGEVEYTVEVGEMSGDAENGYTVTITNSYESVLTKVTVTKNWEDNDDQDGMRPESITVQLTANGENEGDPVTLTADEEWTYTWVELHAYADGEAIEYDVAEIDEIDGYDSVKGEVSGDIENGFKVEITNSHDIVKTTVKVTKVWSDSDDQDGMRPESITVQLTANGKNSGSPVTLTADEEWTYTWTNLNAYEGGEAIEYNVAEIDEIDGYETQMGEVTGDIESGFEVEITNEHETIKTTVKVTKVWEDEDDQDGMRPESITVQLTANGENEGDPVTLDESNKWTYTWEELDAYEGGEAIEYDVAEIDEIEGYDTEKGEVTGDIENGFEVEITNTHETIKTTVTVTKTWEDNDDQDGKRPESITVQLTANGENSGAPVTLDESNKWTYTWEELDAYDGGNAITYDVAEIDEIEGYDSEKGEVTGDIENGFEVEITNTHEIIKTTVTVTKSWEDEEDHDGMRPESITVQLTANGKNSGDPVTLSADEQWTYTWNELDAYADGKAIEYSVAEPDEIEGYESEVGEVTGDIENGFKVEITNTHESLKTTVKVTKTWEDEDDKFGKRPESITVQLTLNGGAEGEAIELNEQNNWTYTWEDLYVIVDKEEAEYAVEESNELPAGYVKEVGDMTGDAENGYEVEITNTFKPVDTDPPVSKEITGGVPSENVTFKFTFEATSTDPEPPMPELTEVEIDGEGETEFGQFWFTEPGTYEYEIKEIKGDAEGYTYDETVYELKYVIEVGADNELVKTVYLDGEKLDGDATVDQIKFTNEYTPEEPIDITVTKTWNDEDDKWSIRPSSIKVSLLANGEVVKTAKLTETDGWTYTFKNVEKTDEDGNDIEYTIDEVKVDGYEDAEIGELTEEEEGVFSIELTNNRADFDPAEEVVTVKKNVENAPKKAATYEFTLKAVGDAPMPDGVKGGTLKIKGSGSSQIKFSFDEPGTYTYTLKEVNTGEKECTYDKAEYKLVFKVTADTKNEKLTVKLIITKGSKSVSGGTVTFTNSYLVKTGDDTNMTPWVVAMATSATVAGTGAVVFKKRRKEEDEA